MIEKAEDALASALLPATQLGPRVEAAEERRAVAKKEEGKRERLGVG